MSTQAPRAAQPAFLIEPVAEQVRYLKAMFYGGYGTGKTTLAASAQDVASMKNVLFIDAEGGTMSIRKRKDIDVIKVTHYNQFARVYEFLQRHIKARDAQDTEMLRKLEAYYRNIPLDSIKEPKIYNTVVVDSLTEVQKYCMYHLLGVNVENFILDATPDSPQYSEWNKSAEMIRLLIRKFRNMPMHIIFVCSAAKEQDETKRYFYEPALPGKLASEVQGFFDVVGYLYTAPVEGGGAMQRRLYVLPGRTFAAKHRFEDFTGSYFDSPTMLELSKYKLMPEEATK